MSSKKEQMMHPNEPPYEELIYIESRLLQDAVTGKDVQKQLDAVRKQIARCIFYEESTKKGGK